MDVFVLRDQFVSDDRHDCESFLMLKDEHSSTRVDDELDDTIAWSDPPGPRNSAVELDGFLGDLVDEGEQAHCITPPDR